MRRGTTLFIAAFLLTACATPPPDPSPAEIADGNYGPYPTNVRAIIMEHLRDILLDPYSAVVTIEQGPAKKWSKTIDDIYYAYGVCASINAKNAYGAYIGVETFFFNIKDDRVANMYRGTAAETKCYELSQQNPKRPQSRDDVL